MRGRGGIYGLQQIDGSARAIGAYSLSLPRQVFALTTRSNRAVWWKLGIWMQERCTQCAGSLMARGRWEGGRTQWGHEGEYLVTKHSRGVKMLIFKALLDAQPTQLAVPFCPCMFASPSPHYFSQKAGGFPSETSVCSAFRDTEAYLFYYL